MMKYGAVFILLLLGYAALAQPTGTNTAGPKVTPVAFASLPTCGASVEGLLYGVTDSNTTTFNATIAAGGANHILAYCNGTNWVAGG